MTYRIAFTIEQALGHITHGQNLRETFENDPSLDAYWVLPSQGGERWYTRVPFISNNWTMNAGLQTRSQLNSISRQVKLDALFFHTQVTAIPALDWLWRIPSVVSLDATPIQYDSFGGLYNHSKDPQWFERLKWAMNRMCFTRAKRLITWSEWVKQSLVNDYQVPSDKINVIPPGVTLSNWTSVATRQGGKNTVKILFVGGNLERKGGLLLVQAFRKLRYRLDPTTQSGNQRPISVELHIVTKDSIPEEPGIFLYRNFQPNSAPLRQLYHDCDIFCLPTLGDTFGIALLEAGAAGLPMVSTDIAAIPEIIIDGQSGFLVRQRDEEALTAALHKLVTEETLRLKLGNTAQEIIRLKFNAETNSLRLLEIIKQMIQEEKHQRSKNQLTEPGMHA